MSFLKKHALPVDFNYWWQRALQESDGHYVPRLVEDAVERDFWKRFIQKKDPAHPDAESAPVFRALEGILSAHGAEDILEIGPGWGNYTFPLARQFRSVTCVDISEDVLDFIEKGAALHGLSSVRRLSGKWEDVQLNRRYDAVFGYNCFYRMLDLESVLYKINASASKVCVVGMGMGVAPPYCARLESELGLELVYGKKDYIYFVNTLYQMGIAANVSVVPLRREVTYPTVEALLEGEARYFQQEDTAKAEHGDAILRILLDFFKTNARGELAYTHTYRGTLVYWTPVDPIL